MLRDRKGNKLYKHVVVKVHFPDGIAPHKIRKKAPARQGFNENGLDEILMSVADQLDKLYPWWTFRMVELASTAPRTAEYSFVCMGLNQNYKPEAPKEETAKEA
jgi:hypothetical protein